MPTIGGKACASCAAALAIIVSAAFISIGIAVPVEQSFLNEAPSPASEPLSYEWTAAQSLFVARASPTVVVLADGNLLVTGGVTAAGATATTEIFDVLQGSWKPGPTMNSKRVGHTATLLRDGTVLVAGGDTGSGATSSAEIIDATALRSYALIGMTFKRSGHAAVLLEDGKVLVAGGTDWVTGIWSQSEIYDPAQHKWSATASMASKRMSFALRMLPDGTALAIGGDAASTSEKYDSKTATWLGAASMQSQRFSSGVSSFGDGRILVAGGLVNGLPVKSGEVYDPVANGWSATKDMTMARARFSLVTIAQGLMLAAGSYAQTTTSSSEMFSDLNDTWWATAPMAHSRGAQGYAVLANGTALVIGGFSDGSITSSVEAFVKAPGAKPTYLQPIDLLPLVAKAEELPGQSGKGLIAKLFAAQAKYDNASFAVCANIMDAFLNQVKAFYQSGHLTVEHATEIYNAYSSVMLGIGAFPQPSPVGISA